MVNKALAPDSQLFQPSSVTKRDNGTYVRFDVKGCTSYLSVMPNDETEFVDNAAPGKTLSEPAKRALREAAERRKAKAELSATRPSEHNGPSGEEPTRFGDWERGGIAYDF